MSSNERPAASIGHRMAEQIDGLAETLIERNAEIRRLREALKWAYANAAPLAESRVGLKERVRRLNKFRDHIDGVLYGPTDDQARSAASVPDLAAIRVRADQVLQAMDEDPGPITAEPYAGWAQREALDALSLVDLIEAARG